MIHLRGLRFFNNAPVDLRIFGGFPFYVDEDVDGSVLREFFSLYKLNLAESIIFSFNNLQMQIMPGLSYLSDILVPIRMYPSMHEPKPISRGSF